MYGINILQYFKEDNNKDQALKHDSKINIYLQLCNLISQGRKGYNAYVS